VPYDPDGDRAVAQWVAALAFVDGSHVACYTQAGTPRAPRGESIDGEEMVTAQGERGATVALWPRPP
jgi:hypothetical protein